MNKFWQEFVFLYCTLKNVNQLIAKYKISLFQTRLILFQCIRLRITRWACDGKLNLPFSIHLYLLFDSIGAADVSPISNCRLYFACFKWRIIFLWVAAKVTLVYLQESILGLTFHGIRWFTHLMNNKSFIHFSGGGGELCESTPSIQLISCVALVSLSKYFC